MDEKKVALFYADDHDRLDEHFKCFQKNKRQDIQGFGVSSLQVAN